MLTTADLAAGITVIFSTVQPFWKLMVSIFGDPFSFFWDQVNTTCSWANTAGMNGIKLSLLKRYNTSLASNGAKFYLGAVLSFSSLQQSGQTPMTYDTTLFVELLGVAFGLRWNMLLVFVVQRRNVFSINRHSKTTLPNWSECGSISVDYDFKHLQTSTTSTIERIVIMCTMICSLTTISNLTQLLLWTLTHPCSSDHQHKLPKHVWRTLFSKNCLNYYMVHARAPFPASSELLENIVIATGTQSFLTTWWFASPLCGLITTIKMRLEHQCFTLEEIQDPLDWHKCKGV